MAIELHNEIEVDASEEATYLLLVDVERVAPCIPGARVIGAREDGGYDAEMRMRLGPMNMTFGGQVEVAEADEANRRAVLVAKAKERGGRGSANATMTMAVRPGVDGGAAVDFTSEISVTGKVAQMGHGVMADVSTQMVGAMAKALEATLQNEASAPAGAASAPAVEAKPPNALALLFGALRDRVRRRWRRLLRRPVAP